VEEERWTDGGGEQAVVAGKLSSKGKGIQVSKVGHSNTGSAGNILVIHNHTLRINSRSVDQREIRERERAREIPRLAKGMGFSSVQACTELKHIETDDGLSSLLDVHQELRTLLVLLCEMGEGHCCTCRSFLKHNAVPGCWREKLMSKFFSDPLWWWDCRLKKANEYESCHNCLVDTAIALLVVMILVWSAKLAGEKSLRQRFFQILCCGGSQVEGG
jgi:hypothetical protein